MPTELPKFLLNERSYPRNQTWSLDPKPTSWPIAKWTLTAFLLGWIIADLIAIYHNLKGG